MPTFPIPYSRKWHFIRRAPLRQALRIRACICTRNNSSVFSTVALQSQTFGENEHWLKLLPPSNEVWGKVIFLHQFVILFTGGGVRGCSRGGAWLLRGGRAWLLPGGVCVARGGGYDDTQRYGQWAAVRILLECILVFCISEMSLHSLYCKRVVFHVHVLLHLLTFALFNSSFQKHRNVSQEPPHNHRVYSNENETGATKSLFKRRHACILRFSSDCSSFICMLSR